MIGRLQPHLTDTQARTWAAKVAAQAKADPQGRGPRFWALLLGLFGSYLDDVLLEMGEPPAPRGRVPVMRTRFYRRVAGARAGRRALFAGNPLPRGRHSPPRPAAGEGWRS